jgi:hypothetical protein
VAGDDHDHENPAQQDARALSITHHRVDLHHILCDPAIAVTLPSLARWLRVVLRGFHAVQDTEAIAQVIDDVRRTTASGMHMHMGSGRCVRRTSQRCPFLSFASKPLHLHRPDVLCTGRLTMPSIVGDSSAATHRLSVRDLSGAGGYSQSYL